MSKPKKHHSRSSYFLPQYRNHYWTSNESSLTGASSFPELVDINNSRASSWRVAWAYQRPTTPTQLPPINISQRTYNEYSDDNYAIRSYTLGTIRWGLEATIPALFTKPIKVLSTGETHSASYDATMHIVRTNYLSRHLEANGSASESHVAQINRFIDLFQTIPVALFTAISTHRVLRALQDNAISDLKALPFNQNAPKKYQAHNNIYSIPDTDTDVIKQFKEAFLAFLHHFATHPLTDHNALAPFTSPVDEFAYNLSQQAASHLYSGIPSNKSLPTKANIIDTAAFIWTELLRILERLPEKQESPKKKPQKQPEAGEPTPPLPALAGNSLSTATFPTPSPLTSYDGEALEAVMRTDTRSIPLGSAMNTDCNIREDVKGFVVQEERSSADTDAIQDMRQRLNSSLSPILFDSTGEPLWGVLPITTPPLDTHFRPSELRYRKRRASSPEGDAFRNLHRYCTDQAVFSRRSRKPSISILLDSSGSMSLTHAGISKLVAEFRGMTLATYNSRGLFILAARGRCITTETLQAQRFGSGNSYDLPALHWLTKQSGPHYWVSDGGVSAVGVFSELASRACYNFVKNRNILQAFSITHMLKILNDEVPPLPQPFIPGIEEVDLQAMRDFIHLYKLHSN